MGQRLQSLGGGEVGDLRPDESGLWGQRRFPWVPGMRDGRRRGGRSGHGCEHPVPDTCLGCGRPDPTALHIAPLPPAVTSGV
jgi:hypothetical protein